MWKTGGDVDIKSRNQVTIFEVTTNITILFAIANDSSKKSAIIRRWFPAELVSEGECLVDGHGPSVLGDGADDRHPLFRRIGAELLAFNCQDRMIHLQTSSVYCLATCLAALA